MMGEGSEAFDDKRLQKAEPRSIASTDLVCELQSKLFGRFSRRQVLALRNLVA